jgi:hypothetical protein
MPHLQREAQAHDEEQRRTLAVFFPIKADVVVDGEGHDLWDGTLDKIPREQTNPIDRLLFADGAVSGGSVY